MLPDRYKAALKALQEQAAAVTMGCQTTYASASKGSLRDAQQCMVDHLEEVKHIVHLVRAAEDSQLTIPTLTESTLERLMSSPRL